MRCPKFMWHIQGTRPGPTVVVLGGTHGNELTGIAAVQILAEMFSINQLPFGEVRTARHPSKNLVFGELYLGFGNPEAILRCSRSASDGPDLNRSFLPTELAQKAHRSDRADLRRAREIRGVLAKADFLLDIHSVSSDSAPFICSTVIGPAHQDAVGLLPSDGLLTDPDLFLARDEKRDDHSTTDSWVNRHGGVGLCYETGRDDRPSDVTRVIPAVLLTLTHKFKVLAPNAFSVRTRFSSDPIVVDTRNEAAPDEPKQWFKLSHSEIAIEREFTYEPEFTHGWKPATAGQLIGTYGSGVTVRAPHAGMVILQRSPERIEVTKSLLYMAVPVA